MIAALGMPKLFPCSKLWIFHHNSLNNVAVKFERVQMKLKALNKFIWICLHMKIANK